MTNKTFAALPLLTLLPASFALLAPAAVQAQDVDPEDERVVVPDLVDEAPVAPPPQAVPMIGVWSPAAVDALLASIDAAPSMGLVAADYDAAGLAAAVAQGDAAVVNEAATRRFVALATHIRDGRTPNSARKQWFVNDSDAKATPMADLLQNALAGGDIAGTLASLEPVHPAYAALKRELALVMAKDTPANRARADRIRVNLERWRWMPRDLGPMYIVSNVPEMMTRVVENGVVLATHKAVVGKPSTATPQLNATATAIILNPTWTLPRSIIAEGTGALIERSPATARARGYTWTGSGKNLSVVQKPGPGNALGVMKLEMLNEHAIYLHDTPSKSAFAADVRAFSHGCIRTDRALHFSGLMAVRYAGQAPDVFGQAVAEGKTARMAFEKPFPVYVAYWTMMPDAAGKLTSYNDLYGRDAPVIASFAAPARAPDVPMVNMAANDASPTTAVAPGAS